MRVRVAYAPCIDGPGRVACGIIARPIGFHGARRRTAQVGIHQAALEIMECLLHILARRALRLAVGRFIALMRQAWRIFWRDRRGCLDLALLEISSHGIRFSKSMDAACMQCLYQAHMAVPVQRKIVHAGQSAGGAPGEPISKIYKRT